jgi:hypothetical protein
MFRIRNTAAAALKPRHYKAFVELNINTLAPVVPDPTARRLSGAKRSLEEEVEGFFNSPLDKFKNVCVREEDFTFNATAAVSTQMPAAVASSFGLAELNTTEASEDEPVAMEIDDVVVVEEEEHVVAAPAAPASPAAAAPRKAAPRKNTKKAVKKEVKSAPKPAIKKKVSKPTAPKKIAHNSDSDSTNKSNSNSTATTDAWSGRLRSRMPAAPKN